MKSVRIFLSWAGYQWTQIMNNIQIYLDSSQSIQDIHIQTSLDNIVLDECDIAPGTKILTFSVDSIANCHRFRLTKSHKNDTENHLQILKIDQITVDEIKIPDYIIHDNCTFKFNNSEHPGCTWLEPPGTWEWSFETPILTYILDQKIVHEAKYTQDYQYAWSYSLGPDSVKNITAKIKQATSKIEKL